MECNIRGSESVWNRSVHQFAKVCVSCVSVLCPWEGVRRVNVWHELLVNGLWHVHTMSALLMSSKSRPCRWEPFVLVLQALLDCFILPLSSSALLLRPRAWQKSLPSAPVQTLCACPWVREYSPVFRWPFWCFLFFPPLAVMLYKHLEMISSMHYFFFFKIFYSLSENINRRCCLVCPAVWSDRTRGRNTAAFLGESGVTHWGIRKWVGYKGLLV